MIEKLAGMISSLFLPAGKSLLMEELLPMFFIPQIFFPHEPESKIVDIKHSLKAAVIKTLA